MCSFSVLLAIRYSPRGHFPERRLRKNYMLEVIILAKEMSAAAAGHL